MKNNLNSELNNIKKLMGIHEAVSRTIPFKFEFSNSGKKILEKARTLNDNDVAGLNLQKKVTDRRGVETNKTISSANELKAELDILMVIDLRNLTTNQKEFLKDLNKKLSNIDPDYVKNVSESLKDEYKKTDPLSQKQFLKAYEDIFDGDNFIIFQNNITKFKFGKLSLPNINGVFKGSKLGPFFLSVFTNKWTYIVLLLGVGNVIYFLRTAGAAAGEALRAFGELMDQFRNLKGKQLFSTIFYSDLLSNLTSEQFKNYVGLDESQANETDKIANDLWNTRDEQWFDIIDTSEKEVKNFFNKLSYSYDGVNLIYFMKKFKEVSGKSVKTFLSEKEININNVINGENVINPEFKFYELMQNQSVDQIDEINKVLDSLNKTMGNVSGYKNLLVQKDSRDSNSDYVNFNKVATNFVLTITNVDGEATQFDYSRRTEILNEIGQYMKEAWNGIKDRDSIVTQNLEKAGNQINKVLNQDTESNQQSSPTQFNQIVDEYSLYSEVAKKLQQRRPEFNKIRFKWPDITKPEPESVQESIGLKRLLSEQNNGDVTFGPETTVKKKNDGQTTNKVKSSSYDTENCPPQNELVKFQTWLDDSKKAWYKNGQLKGSKVKYGTCGEYTKKAWKTYKDEYENWKASGGNFTKPEDNLNNYDASIVKVSKWVRFYDSSNRLLEFLDLETSTPESFNLNKNVIELVKSAESLMLTQYLSPIVSYIKAAVRKYPNIKSFSVPETYSGDLDKYKGQILSENKIIKPVIGLSKLLLEQPTNRKTYEITTGADNKKYLGGERTYNNRGNINVESVISNYLNNQRTYFAPLSLNPGNLPDFAPLIGQVANKLGNPENGNKFTQGLKGAIIKYVDDKNLSYQSEKGDIDFPLVKSLFSNEFASAESARNQSSQPQQPASTPTQQTNVQKTLPETFKFLMRVVERVNAEPTVNFDNCKIIYQTYPKTVNELREDLVDKINRDRTQYDEEINKIKNALKICSTNRKLQTTGSKVKDFLNVFERGINSIKNLPEPFNLNINS